MEHNKPTVSHIIEYTALRCLEIVVRILPRPLALFAGSLLGKAIYLFGFYRDVLNKNMRYVELCPDTELPALQRKLYGNIGRNMAEFLRYSKKLPPFTIDNPKLLDELLALKTGFVVVLGHFGAWEFMAAVFGSRLRDLNVLAKPMRNKLVEEWLARKRAGFRVTTIDTDKAMRKIVRVIDRNGIIAILIDQHVGSTQGTMVPFLGKTANTARTVAGLIEKTGFPLIGGYALLKPDGDYVVNLEKIDTSDIPQANGDLFIAECQKRHNDVLSRWIMAHPDHYFGWFHKRFKEALRY
jgi:Kdo2-lipid IVA lauroyltransferase/acyltransferase